MQDEEANYDSNTLRDLRDGYPLVPIPERKQNACSHGFAAGWNACLDAIEGCRKSERDNHCSIIDAACPYDYGCDACRLHNDYENAKEKSHKLTENLERSMLKNG